MPRSNDPLNKLLRDALHQQKGKISITVKPQPCSPVGDLYKTESNWVQGKTIQLIHRAKNGHESFLGVYVELLNPRASARRLIPAHGTVHGSIRCREVVQGDYWLHPQVTIPRKETPREVKEITERFHELMAQV